MPQPDTDALAGTARPAPGSPAELFLAFTALTLQSFGGALSFMERTLVRDKRWLTDEEFLGMYAISQVLPGPNGITFCVLLGNRFFGWRGAVATVAGFLLVPAIVVLALTSVFLHYRHVPQVQGALQGMGAAAAAITLHTTLRLGRSLRGNVAAAIAAALTFAAIAFAHVPLALVVATVGAASVARCWRRNPK